MSSSEDDVYRERRYHRIPVKKKRRDRKGKTKDGSNFNLNYDRRAMESKHTHKRPPQITLKRLTNKSGFLAGAGAISTFVHSRGDDRNCKQRKPTKKEAEDTLNLLLASAKGKRRSTSKSSISPEIDVFPDEKDYLPIQRRPRKDANAHDNFMFDRCLDSSLELQNKNPSEPLKGKSIPAGLGLRHPEESSNGGEIVSSPIRNIQGSSISPNQQRILQVNPEKSSDQDINVPSNTNLKQTSSIHTYHKFALDCIKALEKAASKCPLLEGPLPDVRKKLIARFEANHKAQKAPLKEKLPIARAIQRASKSEGRPGDGNILKQLCDKAISPMTVETMIKNHLKVTQPEEKEKSACNRDNQTQRIAIDESEKDHSRELNSFKEKSVQLWVNAARMNLCLQNKEKFGANVGGKNTLKQKGQFEFDEQEAEVPIKRSIDNKNRDWQNFRCIGDFYPSNQRAQLPNIPLWSEPYDDQIYTTLDSKKSQQTGFPGYFPENIFLNQTKGINSDGRMCGGKPPQECSLNMFDANPNIKLSPEDYFKIKRAKRDGVSEREREIWKFPVASHGAPTEDKREVKKENNTQSWLAWLTGQNVTKYQPVISPTEPPPLFTLDPPASKRLCLISKQEQHTEHGHHSHNTQKKQRNSNFFSDFFL